MSKRTVVIFNAPPNSGKDAAVEHIMRRTLVMDNFFPIYHMRFKDELIKETAKYFGLTVEKFMEGYDDVVHDAGLRAKDYKRSYIMDSAGELYSQREALQFVSEKVIKPTRGAGYFGEKLAENMPEEGLILVSDSGFYDELSPILNKVGRSNCILVQIERDGCTFEGDTRNYLRPLCNTCLVPNNGTLEEFHHMVDLFMVGVFMDFMRE